MLDQCNVNFIWLGFFDVMIWTTSATKLDNQQRSMSFNKLPYLLPRNKQLFQVSTSTKEVFMRSRKNKIDCEVVRKFIICFYSWGRFIDECICKVIAMSKMDMSNQRDG